MNMEIDILKKGSYGFNLKGSKALKLMMNQDTPPVDLLIRESIQNSADATRIDKRGCLIKYTLSRFFNIDLCSRLSVVGDVLRHKFGSTTQKCLVITDRFTTGLLGGPDEEKGKPNNFYKLVYSFLESGKDNEYSGGSWGAGKSVYYRYGIGMVFYYTRTFENESYHEKLAGAVIENEESSQSLLHSEEDSSGIAFFGRLKEGRKGLRSVPIENENDIKDFLSVFNILPFKDEHTGTKIIIPYFEEKQIIDTKNYNDYVPWEDSFEKCMVAAIQRWYFPRINNEEYNGKFIKVKVNDILIELNPFYKKMQDLYMGKIEGCDALEITTSTFKQKLGTFYYKKFSKDELNVQIPPNNLPSPYAFFDVENERDENSNEAFIFYTRKPGMIITYDDSKSFTSFKTQADEYLIGIFILNDEASYHGEKLGAYFKDVEKADHKLWSDIKTSETIKEIITLRTKPFKAIRTQIRKELESKFGQSMPEEIFTKNSALQKKLGDLLLPPEDFGKDKEPTIKRKKKGTPKDPLMNLKKEKRTTSCFNGFIDGKPSYSFQIFLKPGEQYLCRILVKTSSKKYSLDDWDKLDFILPCYFKSIQIDGYQLNRNPYRHVIKRDYENDFEKNIIKLDGNKDIIFKISPFLTPNTLKVGGIRLENKYSEDLRMNLDILLEPLDETTSFIFMQSIAKIGGGSNG